MIRLKRILEQYPEHLKSVGMLVLASILLVKALPERHATAHDVSNEPTGRNPASNVNFESTDSPTPSRNEQLNKFGSIRYTIIPIGCLENAASTIYVPGGAIRLSAQHCQGVNQNRIEGHWLGKTGPAKDLLFFRERNGRGVASEFFTPADNDQIEFILSRRPGLLQKKRFTLVLRSQ